MQKYLTKTLKRCKVYKHYIFFFREKLKTRNLKKGSRKVNYGRKDKNKHIMPNIW
jgi:hypothetical protein